MLVTFKFNNCYSFKNQQVFSMIPGLMRTHNERIFRGKNHFRLNKFAAFFGSNGSGKSNFVKSLSAMKSIIIYGIETNKAQAFRYLENQNENTEFETELYLDQKMYSYGFTCNFKEKTIIDEWLVEVKPTNDEYLLKSEKGSKPWINEEFLKDEKISNRLQTYIDEVDENKNLLLLPKIVKSTANSEIKDQLLVFYNVFNYFYSKLNITTPNNYVSLNGIDLTDEKNLQRLADLLHKFDTGITKVIKVEVDESRFKEEIPAELYEDVMNDFQKDQTIVTSVVRSPSNFWIVKRTQDNSIVFDKVQFIHFGQNDKPFDLKDESDGTKRMFTLLDILLWDNDDTTFVVDELDRCLHPCLTRTFVNEFLQLAGKQDYKNQLIISTHESRLMNLKYLRRDEIWFVANEGLKGSKIYPFDQFNARYDKVIDEAYLSGRFGAIPDFENLTSGLEK